MNNQLTNVEVPLEWNTKKNKKECSHTSSSNTEPEQYVTVDNYDNWQQGDYASTITNKNIQKCYNKCSNDPKCKGFINNKFTNNCYFKNNLTKNPTFNTFTTAYIKKDNKKEMIYNNMGHVSCDKINSDLCTYKKNEMIAVYEKKTEELLVFSKNNIIFDITLILDNFENVSQVNKKLNLDTFEATNKFEYKFSEKNNNGFEISGVLARINNNNAWISKTNNNFLFINMSTGNSSNIVKIPIIFHSSPLPCIRSLSPTPEYDNCITQCGYLHNKKY